MKARHFIIVMLVFFGFLASCSNSMKSDDPETSFNDQMSAFENPRTPDDQIPSAYDQSMNEQYQQAPTDSDSYQNYPNSYQSSNDSAYASADDRPTPRSSASSMGGGGGAAEVPFSDTRRPAKTPPANIGAL